MVASIQWNSAAEYYGSHRRRKADPLWTSQLSVPTKFQNRIQGKGTSKLVFSLYAL